MDSSDEERGRPRYREGEEPRRRNARGESYPETERAASEPESVDSDTEGKDVGRAASNFGSYATSAWAGVTNGAANAYKYWRSNGRESTATSHTADPNRTFDTMDPEIEGLRPPRDPKKLRKPRPASTTTNVTGAPSTATQEKVGRFTEEAPETIGRSASEPRNSSWARFEGAQTGSSRREATPHPKRVLKEKGLMDTITSWLGWSSKGGEETKPDIYHPEKPADTIDEATTRDRHIPGEFLDESATAAGTRTPVASGALPAAEPVQSTTAPETATSGISGTFKRALNYLIGTDKPATSEAAELPRGPKSGRQPHLWDLMGDRTVEQIGLTALFDGFALADGSEGASQILSHYSGLGLHGLAPQGTIQSSMAGTFGTLNPGFMCAPGNGLNMWGGAGPGTVPGLGLPSVPGMPYPTQTYSGLSGLSQQFGLTGGPFSNAFTQNTSGYPSFNPIQQGNSAFDNLVKSLTPQTQTTQSAGTNTTAAGATSTGQTSNVLDTVSNEIRRFKLGTGEEIQVPRGVTPRQWIARIRAEQEEQDEDEHEQLQREIQAISTATGLPPEQVLAGLMSGQLSGR